MCCNNSILLEIVSIYKRIRICSDQIVITAVVGKNNCGHNTCRNCRFLFFFDDAINAAFYNPMSIAIALIVVGFVFIAVERAKKGKKVRVSRLSDITFLMAFVIGMFQTIAAVFPGTSRSGITIIAMLLMGFSRKLAVEFTFLLAIPVMLGASLAKLVKFDSILHQMKHYYLSVLWLLSLYPYL